MCAFININQFFTHGATAMWLLPWIFSGSGAARTGKLKPPPADWDTHGLTATRTPVPLSRLDGKKRYKVSELTFVDRHAGPGGGNVADDPLFDMSALRPGGVYTRSQLLEEAKTMTASGMFERVSVLTKPNPDGTLGLTVSYAENVWSGADRLKCINVGHMPASPPDHSFGPNDNDMTAREVLEYERRLRGAKRCILPEPVREELAGMVKAVRRISARLLQRLRDRVHKWYHDEGFVCAQVINFGNLDTYEVVCEVVEGGITKLEYQFVDRLGNVVQGNTRIPVIDREVPQQVCSSLLSWRCHSLAICVVKQFIYIVTLLSHLRTAMRMQLRPGHIYNIAAGKQNKRWIVSTRWVCSPT
jgi:hypothetical protein